MFIHQNQLKKYCFHFRRFTEDIYQMTGYRPGLYWQLTWRYIGPGLMALLLCASIWGYIKEVPKYKAWDAELVSSNLQT